MFLKVSKKNCLTFFKKTTKANIGSMINLWNIIRIHRSADFPLEIQFIVLVLPAGSVYCNQTQIAILSQM